ARYDPFEHAVSAVTFAMMIVVLSIFLEWQFAALLAASVFPYLVAYFAFNRHAGRFGERLWKAQPRLFFVIHAAIVAWCLALCIGSTWTASLAPVLAVVAYLMMAAHYVFSVRLAWVAKTTGGVTGSNSVAARHDSGEA